MLEDMIGRATSLDAGSVTRGYVLVDTLPSIVQVNDNAPSLILILSFSTVIASTKALSNWWVVVFEDTPTFTSNVWEVTLEIGIHLPATGSVERGYGWSDP